MNAKKSVLIVDDERDLAEILGILLEDQFHCQVYTRPRDALAILPSTPFDYLITDIEMPGISGQTLVETARRFHPQCGIFVSTGHSAEHPKVKACLEAGADGVLMKPFVDPAALHLTLLAHKA